jgi:micrococcal nuclease
VVGFFVRGWCLATRAGTSLVFGVARSDRSEGEPISRLPHRPSLPAVLFLVPFSWVLIGCGIGATSAATPVESLVPSGVVADGTPGSVNPRQSPPPDAGPYPKPGVLAAARFVRIVDGDTIKVEWKGSVVSLRYIGMNAPETVKPDTPVEWMGSQASAANQKILERSGGTVYLEKDISDTDQYGRLLRYVWIKTGGTWLLVNLELLKLGMAQVETVPPDVKYINPWFMDAQAAARAAGIGLWGSTPKPVPFLGAPGVAICGGNKDAPGDDNLNLNGEYVIVCNRGGSAASLDGWTLTDDGARHTYRFGAFNLAAGASVTLFSGAGVNSATALYWNSNGAVWNNDGDCAHLYAAGGAAVSSRCL